LQLDPGNLTAHDYPRADRNAVPERGAADSKRHKQPKASGRDLFDDDDIA